MAHELLITIGDDLYEVSKFIKNHPGEGIHDIYLHNFHRKNVSEEFEQYHFDDEPHEWLAKAKKLKYDPENGIYYLGPSYFKGKIPLFFHFFKDDINGENTLKDAQPNSFFCSTKLSNPYQRSHSHIQG